MQHSSYLIACALVSLDYEVVEKTKTKRDPQAKKKQYVGTIYCYAFIFITFIIHCVGVYYFF